ncbi:MAG: DUF3078 domain-containing protein [Alistipes sp.]|nr:DUF3078 domain-containing protein [Alistipes sp.]
MKKLCLAISAAAIFAALPAAAQVTIDDTNVDSGQTRFEERVKEVDKVSSEFENEARRRAERAMIRKERNYLEVSASLQGTLTSFSDSWIKTKGGDNAIAAIAQAHLLHNFRKGEFEIETVFDAKFGYNRMKITDANDNEKGVWFKNQDELSIQTAPAWRFSKNWSVGAIIKFRSQFANGYAAREKQTNSDRLSTFMAPGYFDVSLGFTYNCPKERFPIKINLSPIALSSTFVESKAVRAHFSDKDADGEPLWTGKAYGVPVKDTSLYEGGSSVQIDFDRTFGKKGIIRYRTTLYSFYGWISNIGAKAADRVDPTVRWENTVNIKATKFLTTDFSFQMYYNKAQHTRIQTQTLLSVGLTYTFKNKDKK